MAGSPESADSDLGINSVAGVAVLMELTQEDSLYGETSEMPRAGKSVEAS